MQIRSLFFVVTGIFLAGSIQAQTWTLKQLEQEALFSNPAILGKRFSANSAQADVDAAKWQRYPTPGVTMSRDGQGNPNTLLTLQQPLWAGGRISAVIDSAQYRYKASESAVSESQQVIFSQIINAYVEAVRWQDKVLVGKKIVAQHDKLLEMMSRRVAADASPAVDRDLAQARVFQANNDLSVAEQSLGNALTQLSQLTGKRVAVVAELSADAVVIPANKELAIKQALTMSPVLARLSSEAAATGSDVDVQRAALWPAISLRYEHQQADLPFTIAYQRIMVVAQAQTGAGLSVVAGISAADGRREAAKQTRETAARDLEQQVSIDWDGLAFARMQHSNATSASASSTEVYESYARQFTAGRKSWLDVLNTVREAGQYELMVLDANAQMLGAALRLGLWTGELNTLTLQ